MPLALLFFAAACPQLPQPFQHDAINPLLNLDGRAGVVLDFEPGIPPAFSQAIRTSLGRQDVPVFLDKPPAGAFPLHLRQLKGTPRGNTVELELLWELHDAEGLVIDHYDQQTRVADSEWDKGSPALMKRLADEAAPRLAGMMPVEEGTRPRDSLVAPSAKPRLFLQAVEGAPSDGNDSLARAMRLSLSANGIEMAESTGTQTFRLQGMVKIAKADSKSENLRLEWTLSDPSGAEMASLDQEGQVPMGLLDKPWGSLAGEIVAGTAIELAGLLKEAKAAKKP